MTKSVKRVFLTLFIVTMLVFQLGVSITLLPFRDRLPFVIRYVFDVPRSWPFLNYPMYREAIYPPAPIPGLVLEARFRNGSVREVTRADLGVGQFHYLILLKRLRAGNEAVRDQVTQSVANTVGSPPTKLLVVDKRRLLKESGLHEMPDTVIAEIDIR